MADDSRSTLKVYMLLGMQWGGEARRKRRVELCICSCIAVQRVVCYFPCFSSVLVITIYLSFHCAYQFTSFFWCLGSFILFLFFLGACNYQTSTWSFRNVHILYWTYRDRCLSLDSYHRHSRIHNVFLEEQYRIFSAFELFPLQKFIAFSARHVLQIERLQSIALYNNKS